MKGLDTLIKLHKRTLDELRRQIGSVENQKQQLIHLSRKLDEDLKQEMEMASQRADVSQFFGGFAKRIQKRQREIAQEIKTLDKKLDALTEAARVAFSEVKKFEIAKEKSVTRAKKEAARKEGSELDEIAGQQDSRKKKFRPAPR